MGFWGGRGREEAEAETESQGGLTGVLTASCELGRTARTVKITRTVSKNCKVMLEAVFEKNPSGFLHRWGEMGGREASEEAGGSCVLESSLLL